jgi:hypothetical protein
MLLGWIGLGSIDDPCDLARFKMLKKLLNRKEREEREGL